MNRLTGNQLVWAVGPAIPVSAIGPFHFPGKTTITSSKEVAVPKQGK